MVSCYQNVVSPSNNSEYKNPAGYIHGRDAENLRAIFVVLSAVTVMLLMLLFRFPRLRRLVTKGFPTTMMIHVFPLRVQVVSLICPQLYRRFRVPSPERSRVVTNALPSGKDPVFVPGQNRDMTCMNNLRVTSLHTQADLASNTVTTCAVVDTNPPDCTCRHKDYEYKYTARKLVGHCYGTGELTEDMSDLETRGDNEGESSVKLLVSTKASGDSLSQHTAQNYLSVDQRSEGDVNESSGLAESLFSRCAKVVNIVCPNETIKTIPEAFGIVPEALSSSNPRIEGTSSSNLSMVQLVCLPGRNFECTDVTRCLDTVTLVLRRAREAMLLFLLPTVDLLGKKASWVSDLRTVILNSGIRCQLSMSSTTVVKASCQKLHVVFTNQGEFTDKGSNFVGKVRRSLRDLVGLTILNHELWELTKGSKILPLIESGHRDLLEMVKNSAGRQLPDCGWMELENILLKKKCGRTEKENYQEVVNFARRKGANLQTVFDHVQQIGLLLYFCPGDDLVEEVKETKTARKEAGRGPVTWSANSGDSGVSQGSECHNHSLHSTFSILHPSSFSSNVNMLSDLCYSLDMELNNSLIPVARRHGFLPKRRVLGELHKFPAGFSHAVHWSGILIDPAWCLCSKIGCTGTLSISSQGPEGTELQQSYLFPTALQSNKLPPLHNYATVCPLAYRQPGVMQVDIPLIVFYHLIGHLMKHVPKVLSCGKHGFRFLVDLSHLLDVEYKGYYIQIAVHVPDQKLDSSITAQVCKSVKARITTCLKYVVETTGSYQGLSLEPSILLSDDINSYSDVHADFVDFPVSVPSSTSNTFVSVGGLDVKLPNDILHWYGRLDQEASQIRSNFQYYVETIDACKTAAWLYERGTFTPSEYDSVIQSDSGAQPGRVLRLLERKKEIDPNIMKTILQQSHLRKQRATETDMEVRIDKDLHGSIGERPEEVIVARKQLHDQAASHAKPDTQQRTSTLSSSSRFDLLQNNLDKSTHEVPSPGSERPSSALARGRLDQENLIEASASLSSERFYNRLPVAVTSPVTRSYTELQGQLAFPRAEPTVPQAGVSPLETSGPVAEFHLATEKVVSVSRTEAKDQEPEIHPIYESKYWHVQRATDNFNERPLTKGGKRLGVGSFGTVFYGTLHSESGQKYDVAVKRLKKASSLNPAQVELSRKQFGVEMNLLTRYIHPNIVRLVGFSSDGPELCLVYEYMENGALSHRLDCKDRTPPLDWRVRLTIGRDIADALDFLHNRYRLPVIHRDVKSANVLLGKEFEAKLSDFGLAIVGDPEDKFIAHHGPSVGTRPYMAPEATEGVIVPAIDVYSLGMILYELATGLPPFSSKKKQTLNIYMNEMERQNVDLTKMLDPKARWPKVRGLEGRIHTPGLGLLDVARRSTTTDYKRRPTMKEVAGLLKQLVEKADRK